MCLVGEKKQDITEIRIGKSRALKLVELALYINTLPLPSSLQGIITTIKIIIL